MILIIIDILNNNFHKRSEQETQQLKFRELNSHLSASRGAILRN